MENEQEFARRAMIQSEQEKHNSWKSGNEYLPFHPMASHVTPEYRAGWNDAYAAGKARVSNQERDSKDAALKQLYCLLEYAYFSTLNCNRLLPVVVRDLVNKAVAAINAPQQEAGQ